MLDRSRLVKLGYEDENSMISPAIISKMNLVKKIKKTIYFLCEICYNIYVNKKERKLNMIRKFEFVVLGSLEEFTN